MLAWVLIAAALLALVFDPGVEIRTVVAGAVIGYLILKYRSRDGEPPDPEVDQDVEGGPPRGR